MSAHEAVIYDLDGTLIELAVDWDEVASDAAAAYRAAGRTPPDDLWEMLEGADSAIEPDVRSIIREHECQGARKARRLPMADALQERRVPVGVCSLNCERACELALERHDLHESVEIVVGRDTVEPWKPAPEPLLAIADTLTVDPAQVLFVGDSPRDERAAKRAGMDFEWV